jgi:hypothetical protein
MAFGDTFNVATNATTPVVLIAGSVLARGRGSVTFSVPNASSTVYVSNSATVTTSTGFAVTSGPPTSIDIVFNGQTIYAIAASGTPTITAMLGA